MRLGGIVLVLAAVASAGLQAASGPRAPRPLDAAAARVLAAARRQLGEPYRYGGSGPDEWDCSGLVFTVWRTAGGVTGIPRTSREQQRWVWPISAKTARPGDLVFFGEPVHHVAFYLGRGRILDASGSRGKVVVRTVWTSDVVRYGRVPRPGLRRPRPPARAPSAAPARRPKPAPTPATAGEARRLRPVPSAAHRPRTRPPAAVARFVALVRSQAGRGWADHGTGPAYDAAGLVRWAWRRAGLGVVGVSPAGIEWRTRPVSLAGLRVGDLVLYGAPAVHVGVYVGGGRMVDASRVLRRVVLRPVFASETVRFARLRLPA